MKISNIISKLIIIKPNYLTYFKKPKINSFTKKNILKQNKNKYINIKN